MIFDVKTLATINLIAQAIILITVLVAVFLARRKQFMRHCNIVRVAVAVQLLSIFLIMLPVMLGYIKNPRQTAFQTEMLAHHSLGVLVILLWVYINLAFMGRVRLLGKLAIFMRSALSIWVLAFLFGLYLYVQTYVI